MTCVSNARKICSFKISPVMYIHSNCERACALILNIATLDLGRYVVVIIMHEAV